MEEAEDDQAKGEGQDDVDNGIGSAIETLEELRRTEGLTTNSTRAVLLERCCATLNRCVRLLVLFVVVRACRITLRCARSPNDLFLCQKK